jgi:TPR repeat protein
MIRSARAGDAAAQSALGKLYLFGGVGLQKKFATALYWLDRAARQNEQQAWTSIGLHVPFEFLAVLHRHSDKRKRYW